MLFLLKGAYKHVTFFWMGPPNVWLSFEEDLQTCDFLLKGTYKHVTFFWRGPTNMWLSFEGDLQTCDFLLKGTYNVKCFFDLLCKLCKSVVQVRGQAVEEFITSAQDRSKSAHMKSMMAAFNSWEESLHADQVSFESNKILLLSGTYSVIWTKLVEQNTLFCLLCLVPMPSALA